MKAVFIIILVFVVAHKSNAQLPSEKPLSEVYSPLIKAKLESPKDGTANKQLPSERKSLPKAAQESKQNNANKVQPTQQDAAKLPSNKRVNGKAFNKQKPKSR